MAKKTLAMRVLESSNISYEVITYDDTIRDSTLIAKEIDVPEGQVFKTLVVIRKNNNPMLVMIPSNRELNLKRLAKEIGEKKVKMASHYQAEELTGLQVGGISALVLLNKGFGIYLDNAAESFNQIYVSGGKKGLQIKVSVRDFIKITRANLVHLSDQPSDTKMMGNL